MAEGKRERERDRGGERGVRGRKTHKLCKGKRERDKKGTGIYIARRK